MGLFDLSVLIDTVTDYGYAAGAAGQFSLAAGSYRQTYLTLYSLYEDVAAQRQQIEAEASGISPRQVSPVIAGVVSGSASAQRTLGERRNAASLVEHLRSLEYQLADILNGMYRTFATTVSTDHDGATGIARAIP